MKIYGSKEKEEVLCKTGEKVVYIDQIYKPNRN